MARLIFYRNVLQRGAHGPDARTRSSSARWMNTGPSRTVRFGWLAPTGTCTKAAIENGIIFQPCFIEEGIRINTVLHSIAGRGVFATMYCAL